MRKQREEKWDIKGYDCYGLTEICGPGAGGECEYQNGSNLWEDYFLPEIIDPQTLKPVPIGKEGELVITTLAKEGQPAIRYRTRDLTAFNPEQCECGRTAIRIKRVLGRSDDMMVIR
jgi:phenylacetate-CoA ligase